MAGKTQNSLVMVSMKDLRSLSKYSGAPVFSLYAWFLMTLGSHHRNSLHADNRSAGSERIIIGPNRVTSEDACIDLCTPAVPST